MPRKRRRTMMKKKTNCSQCILCLCRRRDEHVSHAWDNLACEWIFCGTHCWSHDNIAHSAMKASCHDIHPSRSHRSQTDPSLSSHMTPCKVRKRSAAQKSVKDAVTVPKRLDPALDGNGEILLTGFPITCIVAFSAFYWPSSFRSSTWEAWKRNGIHSTRIAITTTTFRSWLSLPNLSMRVHHPIFSLLKTSQCKTSQCSRWKSLCFGSIRFPHS